MPERVKPRLRQVSSTVCATRVFCRTRWIARFVTPNPESSYGSTVVSKPAFWCAAITIRSFRSVVGGSSADESGLIEPGDVLTQVDDVKVTKSSIADISGMVLGTPGESVKLKFTRTVGKSKKKYKKED